MRRQVAKLKKPELKDFRGDIQGLRAIAVTAVILDHAEFKWASGGYVGVDIFFVISGYLMTGFLWRRLSTDGSVDLMEFYGRRAKRLLPAACVVLVATSLAGALIFPSLRWASTAKDVLASALYAENWRLAYTHVDYLNAAGPPSPLQHYWSLAVEEQFYIGWPLIFLTVILFNRRRDVKRARWLIITGISAATSISLCWCIYYTAHSPDKAYFSTFTRIWELGLGGLIALTATSRSIPVPTWFNAILSWTSVAGLFACIATFRHGLSFPGYYALAPTACTAILIMCAPLAGSWSPTKFLGCWPLRKVGDISYALYLWHWPILVFAAERYDRLSFQTLALLLAMCLMLAYFTSLLIEEPIRKAESLSMDVWSPIKVGLLATSTACLVGLLVLAYAPRPSLGRTTGEVAATNLFYQKNKNLQSAETTFGAQILSQNPRGDSKGKPLDKVSLISDLASAASFMGCPQPLVKPGIKTCIIGNKDTGKSVMLLGDSHAQQWLPAIEQLALDNDWRVSVVVKEYCLVMDGQLNEGVRRQNPTCLSWNKLVTSKIARERPSLIITSNYILAGESVTEAARAQHAKFSHLTQNKTKLVVISDTPKPPANPVECLSKNSDMFSKCSFPRTAAMVNVGRSQKLAVEGINRAAFISLNDAICPTPKCAATMGGVVVYRDDNHITNLFALSLTDRLESQMTKFAPELFSRKTSTQ